MNKNKNDNKRCYAKVDPEYLKKVSEMLQKEMKEEKDTANYNSQVISNFIDKSSIALRDAGQSEIKNGDALKIHEEIDALNQNREASMEKFDTSKSFNYDLDNEPFTNKLELEQRTKHILRTEALDTFESLMDDLDVYMPRFIEMDIWARFKMAISKGNERVAKNNLIFIGPETILGKEMKLSTKEMQTLGFSLETGNLTYDLRPDGPDLLAMKELVRILKGGDVEDLSFAAGFFAKYTHELNADKFGPVVFHVVDKKLKAIRTIEFTHRRSKEELQDGTYLDNRFTPVQTFAMLSRLLYERTQSMDENVILNELKENEKYFFVFHGFIAAPKDNSHFGYEKEPKINELVIRSGEVLLVKKMKGQIHTSRIYFVPEDYKHFHPYHQHGSVIFGNNDYSYHSSTDWACMGMTRQYFIDEVYVPGNFDSLYQPAFVFCLASKLKNPNREFILEGQNGEQFTHAFFNLYEENKFIFHRLLKWKVLRYKLNLQEDTPKNEAESELLDKYEEFFYQFGLKHLLPNYAPLHKKWTLREYMNGESISEKRQDGTIDKVAKDYAADNSIAIINSRKK